MKKREKKLPGYVDSFQQRHSYMQGSLFYTLRFQIMDSVKCNRNHGVHHNFWQVLS